MLKIFEQRSVAGRHTCSVLLVVQVVKLQTQLNVKLVTPTRLWIREGH